MAFSSVVSIILKVACSQPFETITCSSRGKRRLAAPETRKNREQGSATRLTRVSGSNQTDNPKNKGAVMRQQQLWINNSSKISRLTPSSIIKPRHEYTPSRPPKGKAPIAFQSQIERQKQKATQRAQPWPSAFNSPLRHYPKFFSFSFLVNKG